MCKKEHIGVETNYNYESVHTYMNGQMKIHDEI